MKIRYLILLAGLCLNTALADFSSSLVQVHPLYPADGPFILEISGDWPSDCHPGEQLPVIKAFDETSVAIEYEFIVIHVTCNDFVTPYRSLVDMSDVVRTGIAFGDSLDVHVTFGEISMQQTVELVCPQGMDCENQQENQPRPMPGVYEATGLASQGILVARQNTGMAVYPLSYDETGMPEWMISGGHMAGNSFFGKMTHWSGGDCFGCEPSGAIPEKRKTDTLSVLVDAPGVLQVKVNDNMFREYRSVVYGYAKLQVGPKGEQSLVDLEGRWGLVENRGTNPPLGDLTEFLPGVFDLVLEDFVTADSSIQQDGQVSYLLTTPTGEELGQVVCKGQISEVNGNNVCEFIDPTDAAEPLFLFYQDGHSGLAIQYGRAVIAIGTPPGGRAVRLE